MSERIMKGSERGKDEREKEGREAVIER